MALWGTAWRYVPALVGLSLLLALASAALYDAVSSRRWCGAFSPRTARIWAFSAVGMGILGAIVSVHTPGAFLLSLVTVAVALSFCLLWLGHQKPLSTAFPDPPSSPFPGPLARTLFGLEVAILAIATPILWFPTVRPPLAAAAAVAIALSWLLRPLASRFSFAHENGGEGLWPASPYDFALLVFLIMAAISTWRTDSALLTLPKACSLFLGLAVWRLFLWNIRDVRSLAIALGIFLGVAIAIAALGLLGGLRYVRFPAAGQWLARLPRFFQAIPETQGGRVSLNQLGGAILYAWPLALAIAMAPWRAVRSPGLRSLALAAALALGAALFLTQSRGAWLGPTVGLFCFLLLRLPGGRWLALASLAVSLFAWLRWEATLRPIIVHFLSDPKGLFSPIGALSLQGRLAIWTQTISDISRSPWLGHGLGTFRLFHGGAIALSPFDAGMPHAHNVFLQVAYDLGLPGLVAYGGLFALGLREAACLSRSTRDLRHSVGIGAIAGLTAFHIFGITDTVALGAKPGLLWWFLLAIIAAAAGISEPEPVCPPKEQPHI